MEAKGGGGEGAKVGVEGGGKDDYSPQPQDTRGGGADCWGGDAEQRTRGSLHMKTHFHVRISIS